MPRRMVSEICHEQDSLLESVIMHSAQIRKYSQAKYDIWKKVYATMVANDGR